ncbi:hypothetical protein AYO38_07300 [bacterium SCGC AG-212-C10]|nr:hypothetical protein AYO38_07300 [bacterium SCGC AG-212-C10]
MTLALVGSLALRTPAHAGPIGPGTFAGTAVVEFPGTGVGPVTIPASVTVLGNGTTINDVLFQSFGIGDGSFSISTLGSSWNLQSPFANYAKGTITGANIENIIQSPPAPTTPKIMANNTKIRVTIYNANQANILVQVEGTSGGLNFRITFTGANCGLIALIPGCVPV